MEKLVCAKMFFSLASVSFYCKDCAGNFFLKSSTNPSKVKWSAPKCAKTIFSEASTQYNGVRMYVGRQAVHS